MPECPGCGRVPLNVNLASNRQLLHARKYVNHSSEPGRLCRCGKYASYYGSVVEAKPRVGRPRLGKEHCRSPEAKKRRNERRNKKRKLEKKVHWTSTIVDGMLVKSKIRPGKPTKSYIQNVPPVVAQAIRNLSSLPAVKPARKAKRLRTPRRRTRSQQIERLQALLEQTDVMNDIKRWDRINMALEEEYLLQARRDVQENLDGSFLWSDTAESVYANRYAQRATSGTIPGRAAKKRYGFMLTE